MENLQEFKQLIAQPKNVVIVMHFKPDADALGSSLGLAGFLKSKGHQVKVIAPSDYPEFLFWMPGQSDILVVDKKSSEKLNAAKGLIAKADVIFCLDFSALNRIDALEEPVRNAQAIKVNIDHHLAPENFASFSKWTVQSASTAGLIFELIEELGEKHLITADIANCLYAGLMTDTGGFRHNNTREKEFLIASELVHAGANPHVVAKNIYDTNSIERLKLTGYVLNEKLTVLPEFRTAYITLTSKELNAFGSQTGDTEGLVNYGLSIKNIRLSVLIYDRAEEIKLSLRSVGDFNVNEMARKYFEGGGHRNASGGSSKLTMEKTIEKFLSILPEYKIELLKD
jgi:bifunctional oligoribonuclease and PAP phosphatase NrnA